MSWLKIFSIIFVFQFARYLLISGSAFFYFWRYRSADFKAKQVQKISFKQKDILREIKYSLVTSLVFGLVFAIPFHESFSHYTKVYSSVADFGWAWFFLSLPVLLLIHDSYFYWMHRLIHHPKLFKRVHGIHHASTNPSPFAAYSFHPTEAILELLWVLPVLFFMPVHEYMILIFSILALIMNVIGHLGVEIFPETWKTHSVYKWLNSATNHNGHHLHFNGNYGLYFTWWDRWMGTVIKSK